MEVRVIAVIGAGILGRGIACDAAIAGYQVVLEDVSEDRLDRAHVWIREKLESCAIYNPALVRVRPSASEVLALAHTVEEAIREADLVVETLPDEMEMQIELFTVLDKFAKPHAIFATTGLLSITELAEVTFCADRCIGMRFSEGQSSEGIDATALIQLVRGSETSSGTIAACAEFAQRMGREVVVLDDAGVNQSGERRRKLTHAQD